MKKNLFIIIFFIQFTLGINILFGQEIANNNDLKTKIDTYLNASFENGYSASVLVAKHEDVILSKGYGWSDRQKKRF